MNKFYSFIGIATKAGKTVSGEFAVEKALKEGKAVLVIVSEDASDNTKKHFSDMCGYREIPIKFIGTKQELGQVTGNETRTSIAVTDPGFAQRIMSLLQEVMI